MNIDPKAPPMVITLTKAEVAQWQLETAIWIWFHYGDPISILTLASASNNCYKALGGHIGKPSRFEDWLKSKSRAFQDRARYVINWVKHGRQDMKKKPNYHPIIGEILMLDSIECHNNLHESRTPLMGSLKVDDLLERDRTRFFNKASERLFGRGG